MELKDNLRTITVLLIPIIIGLSIPYTLLLNQTETWQLLFGMLAILVILFLFIKYQISFLFFALFSLFGIMNTSIKPFDLVLVIMFLLMWLITKRKIFHFTQLKFVHFSLFFFLLINLLSIMNSTDLKLGIDYFIHSVFVTVIFYFIFLFVNEEKKFKGVLWGYIISAIISSLFVVGEFFGVLTGFNSLFQGHRAQGLFLDPNDFSPFLLLAILFLIHQFSTKSLTTIHSYGYLLTSLFLMGILLTSLSRAAILNLFISLTIYFCFYLVNRGSLKHFHLFISIIGLSVFALYSFLKESIINWLSMRFFASSGGVMQSYDTERFYYQMQGIKLGSSNLFGIGPGQFELLMNYATHNLYIRIIAENGWLALLLFLTMIIFIFIQLWKNRKETVWGIPIYLFLSGYIGLLINSYFLDTLHWRYLWFYLGLCAVLIVNLKKAKDWKEVD
jgi:O-antigen ligase